MAEFTNPNIVTVSAGENLPLTETAVKGPACIVHREGAGIVTLRGRDCHPGGSRKLLQCFRGCVHRGAAWLLRDRGG